MNTDLDVPAVPPDAQPIYPAILKNPSYPDVFVNLFVPSKVKPIEPWLLSVSEVFQVTAVFVLAVILWVVLLYLANAEIIVAVPLVPELPDVPEDPEEPEDPEVPEDPLVPEVPLVPFNGATSYPLKVKTLAVVEDNANNTGLEIWPNVVGSVGVNPPATVGDRK